MADRRIYCLYHSRAGPVYTGKEAEISVEMVGEEKKICRVPRQVVPFQWSWMITYHGNNEIKRKS